MLGRLTIECEKHKICRKQERKRVNEERKKKKMLGDRRKCSPSRAHAIRYIFAERMYVYKHVML